MLKCNRGAISVSKRERFVFALGPPPIDIALQCYIIVTCAIVTYATKLQQWSVKYERLYNLCKKI